MTEGPLNESEMAWLEETLMSYGHDDASVLDVSELDGMFGYNDIDGESYTVVEEWCYGYMRGVALTDWSALPDELKADLDVIALHGSEEIGDQLDELTEEEYTASIERIQPAALRLYNYWVNNPQQPEVKKPMVNGTKVGRNDPCPCGSGKKFKSCCLH